MPIEFFAVLQDVDAFNNAQMWFDYTNTEHLQIMGVADPLTYTEDKRIETEFVLLSDSDYGSELSD